LEAAENSIVSRDWHWVAECPAQPGLDLQKWVLHTGIIMDLNLETLKGEILDYLEHSEFAVFRSHAGALEGLPMITWDTERCPDYRTFLEVAQKAGEKLTLFASSELTEEEVDEILEELEDTEFTREERQTLEGRLGKAQRHVGETCTLELAFDHNSHLYVYEVQPDWYEDFLDACEEINAVLPIEEEAEGSSDDSLGGFYSNN
jgi:hypothetical protein